MSKWYGDVLFEEEIEYQPGCWDVEPIKKPYYGDVITDRWKRQNSNGINDDVNLSKSISIVADPYAVNHCSTIVAVEYMGNFWKVTDVEPQFPRLILSVGGVWNGPKDSTSVQT